MATATVIRHGEALRKSTEITRTLRRMYRPEVSMIAPADVIAVLHEAGVRFVLMGNYGITGWRGEARATEDVDILVRTRDHRKAVRAIQDAFPQLQVVDLQVVDYPVVTRFLDPVTKAPLIGLMKPNQPLFKVAFRQTILDAEGYLIPNLEFALACKFAAMVSPNRADEKKFLDAADFTSIVRKNLAAIRQDRLRRLGEKVYPGGGAEIIGLVEDIKAGRRIVF
jgi:predicted nucleotidyltransferase